MFPMVSADTPEVRRSRRHPPTKRTRWFHWAGRLLGLLGLLAGWWALGRPDGLLVTYGHSMLPTIRPNTFVILDSMAHYTIHIGDIVAVHIPLADQTHYHYPPTMLHRVIALSRRRGAWWIHTKGDNNTLPEPFWVPAKDVFGHPVLMVPYLGYVIEYLRTPWGWMGMSAAALCFGGYRLLFSWDFTKSLSPSASAAEPSLEANGLHDIAHTLSLIEAELKRLNERMAKWEARQSPTREDAQHDSQTIGPSGDHASATDPSDSETAHIATPNDGEDR